MTAQGDPLVSIVIPVYNGSDYLRYAIESALGQDFQDREVLVVNDGSDDGGQVEAIARSYGDRIRYIAKENGGVGSALNAGIMAMRGTYFSWLSHDDIYEPGKLSAQVALMRGLPQGEAVLYSDFVHVDQDNEPLFEVRIPHELCERKPLYALFFCWLNGCTMLIPRRAFDEVGLFRDLPATQDYDMWGRLIRRYPFIHLPQVVLRSRMHPAQGSRRLASDQEADDLWIRLLESLTPDELASLEHREELFFHRMAKHLAQTPYRRAYALAHRRSLGLPWQDRLRLWSFRGTVRKGLAKAGLLPLALGLNVFLKGGASREALQAGLRVVRLERLVARVTARSAPYAESSPTDVRADARPSGKPDGQDSW